MTSHPFMDTAASAELQAAYKAAAREVMSYRYRLAPLVAQAEQLIQLPQAESLLRALNRLPKLLVDDGRELVRRRQLFMLADRATLEQFQQLNPQLKIWDYRASDHLPPDQFAAALANHRELSRAELAKAFRGALWWSVDSPQRAAQALGALGVDAFAELADRIMYDLQTGLAVEGLRDEALLMLQALALLVAQASRSPVGLPSEFRDYLLPRTAGADPDQRNQHNPRNQLRHLGMLLSMGHFSDTFTEQAASYLLDHNNRDVISSALLNHPLAARGTSSQPYQAMLSPLESVLRQSQTSPQLSVAMLRGIMSSNLATDLDAEQYHGARGDEAVANLVDAIVNEAAVNPAFRQQSWAALLQLFEWLPQNSGGWSDASPAWPAMAQLVGLHWPELRHVATDITAPVLARIVNNSQAMVLLSVSAESYTLGQLSEAVEAELNPRLSDTVRDRHISVHVDAVADVHHHIFTAAARVSEKPRQRALSLLTSALNFVDKKLFKVLLVGSLTPQLRLATTVASMGVKKLREQVTEAVESQAPQHKVTPQQIFTQQFANRDQAVAGGLAPEPTWFQIELANKIFEHRPHLAQELMGGGGGGGGSGGAGNSNFQSHWFQDGKIKSDEVEQSAAFAAWFSGITNADPPTEFSSLFIHLQREFTTDLLLDATSVAVDGISSKADAAFEISRQTQREWQEWSQDWRDSREAAEDAAGGGARSAGATIWGAR